MKYNMGTGVANADGNVRLISPPRNLTARADRAIYNTKEADGTIRLIGHATATQNDDTVSGDTLTITGAGGKVAMGEGNVKMVVLPQSTQPRRQKPGKDRHRCSAWPDWPMYRSSCISSTTGPAIS